MKHILCSQREDNGKISYIISEGVELLEAPFKQVCKEWTVMNNTEKRLQTVPFPRFLVYMIKLYKENICIFHMHLFKIVKLFCRNDEYDVVIHHEQYSNYLLQIRMYWYIILSENYEWQTR
jgi:hypothetical protein